MNSEACSEISTDSQRLCIQNAALLTVPWFCLISYSPLCQFPHLLPAPSSVISCVLCVADLHGQLSSLGYICYLYCCLDSFKFILCEALW